MFALDTNSLIYFFKGMGGVADHMLATAPVDIGVPTIVIYELEVGIAKSRLPEKRRAQVDALLRTVNLLPFDRASAAASARIRASLEASGTPIGPMDTLIAGTAMAAAAVLVTHNEKEFRRVPGLQVVDWF